MKSIGLIFISLIFVVSFQNCAEDPYSTADESSKNNLPGMYFGDSPEDDIEIDFGALDSNIPTPSNGDNSNTTDAEYTKRKIIVTHLPSEPYRDRLYSAKPFEYMVMTNNELAQLDMFIQDNTIANSPKIIRIAFSFSDTKNLRMYILDSDKNVQRLKLNQEISNTILTSLKNITICEFTMQTDKPMCAQRTTPVSAIKLYNQDLAMNIGQKSDECPLRYVDICPSKESLYVSLLGYIGSNYRSWIEQYSIQPQ